jgi:hypothetical protein
VSKSEEEEEEDDTLTAIFLPLLLSPEAESEEFSSISVSQSTKSNLLCGFRAPTAPPRLRLGEGEARDRLKGVVRLVAGVSRGFWEADWALRVASLGVVEGVPGRELEVEGRGGGRRAPGEWGGRGGDSIDVDPSRSGAGMTMGSKESEECPELESSDGGGGRGTSKKLVDLRRGVEFPLPAISGSTAE